MAQAVRAAPAQGFLSTRGTSIVDSSGRTVILRGVNYPGYEQIHPKPHSSADYTTLSSGFGFNVVRLQISWANLEPQPGNLNASYLANYVDRDVSWASSAGIYVVLDMHQYNWAARFGGDGAPDWSVRDYSPNATGMRRAVSEFWSNATLQAHLVRVWEKIAQRYANQPTIAGYDLLNEPMLYTSLNPQLNATALDSFYFKLVQAIRAVDPDHLIFLEPANMNTYKLPTRINIVWSPHYYPLASAGSYNVQNFTLLENDFAVKYRTFLIDSGIPMWIGEFGALMPDNTSRGAWTQDALTLFNRYQIGWAWWAYVGQYRLVPDQLYVPN